MSAESNPPAHRPARPALARCMGGALLLVALVGGVACDPAPEPTLAPSPVASRVPAQGPEDLHPAERAFLEARLARTVELLEPKRRDATDGLLLAFAIYLEGDDEAAKAVFDRTMRSPVHRDKELFRGLLASLTGDLEQAIEQFDAARKLPRRRFFAQALYVETLVLAERFAEAEAAVAVLEGRYPQEPIVFHSRGHLESGRKDWKAASAAYLRSEELGGRNPDLDDGIVEAMTELGELAGARERVDRTRADFPDHVEILFHEIRLLRREVPRRPEALASTVAEYKRRTKRSDRVKEIDQWASEDTPAP